MTNVGLHVLGACAVYPLLRHLLADSDPGAALAGALLFAVHPLQTEAVAWASATKDLLSALCSFDLGQILEEQGGLDEALVHYRAAAADSLDGAVNVGNVLAKQGRYDEAIGHYTAVFARMSYLEQHTRAAAYMHNNLGVAYMRKNMVDEAAREFERAVGIVPGYVQPYLNLGSMLMSTGRYADAAQVFRRGLAASPTDEGLRTQLGVAMSRAGG